MFDLVLGREVIVDEHGDLAMAYEGIILHYYLDSGNCLWFVVENVEGEADPVFVAHVKFKKPFLKQMAEITPTPTPKKDGETDKVLADVIDIFSRKKNPSPTLVN